MHVFLFVTVLTRLRSLIISSKSPSPPSGRGVPKVPPGVVVVVPVFMDGNKTLGVVIVAPKLGLALERGGRRVVGVAFGK